MGGYILTIPMAMQSKGRPWTAMECNGRRVDSNGMPWHSTAFHAMTCACMTWHDMPGHVMPYYAITWHVMPWRVMPWPCIACYGMSCHIMACHDMRWTAKDGHAALQNTNKNLRVRWHTHIHAPGLAVAWVSCAELFFTFASITGGSNFIMLSNVLDGHLAQLGQQDV